MRVGTGQGKGQAKDSVELTPCGRYAAQIASAYGVTVSYLPLFMVLNTLLFGNPRIPRIDENGFETLVNRALNVWGSGGAHATYFNKVDEIIVEIFNRPLALQPRGICDMGCGDGTLLAHLYSVVSTRTARGRDLDRHPLIIVGADFNKVARRASKQTLRRSGVPVFHVIHGDINRPAQLAGDLEELGHDVHDLLHIRSFLDHNRAYVPLANYTRGTRTARSSGAFAYLGEEIRAEEIEENLVRHLRGMQVVRLKVLRNSRSSRIPHAAQLLYQMERPRQRRFQGSMRLRCVTRTPSGVQYSARSIEGFSDPCLGVVVAGRLGSGGPAAATARSIDRWRRGREGY